MHILWPTPKGKYTKAFGLYIGHKEIEHDPILDSTNYKSKLPWIVRSKTIRIEGKGVFIVLLHFAVCHCRKLYECNMQILLDHRVSHACTQHLYMYIRITSLMLGDTHTGLYAVALNIWDAKGGRKDHYMNYCICAA